MTRKHPTEEQIMAVLKDAQAEVSVQDLCRTHGSYDATFETWRTKYASLEISAVKKLRQLEEENRRLKQMVAEHALNIQALQARTTQNWYGPRRRGRRRTASENARECGEQAALGVPSDLCTVAPGRMGG